MDESSKEVVIAQEGAFDPNNPKSLFNLLSSTYQEHFTRVKNSFLGDTSEWVRIKEIKHLTEFPLIRKLRQSFWIEYDNAVKGDRKMNMVNVWPGICITLDGFHDIMEKDHYAAFIFTKPTAKDAKEKALLEFAYEQIEKILAASHLTKDGLMNHGAAKLKIEVWKHLDERVHGGVVKQVRVQSDQRSLNVNVTKTELPTNTDLNRAEELTERLKELRDQTRDLEAIETSSTVVTETEYHK